MSYEDQAMFRTSSIFCYLKTKGLIDVIRDMKTEQCCDSYQLEKLSKLPFRILNIQVLIFLRKYIVIYRVLPLFYLLENSSIMSA
jgi:hypothetical protein